MVINNKQLYKITLTREQLMLISQCVEDISRFAAGDMDLQHTTDTLIDDMDCDYMSSFIEKINNMKYENR